MFRIFDKLGGENSSLEIIAAAEGRRPSADVVGKWKRERRIPTLRAVSLLDECVRRGDPALYSKDCVAISEDNFSAPSIGRTTQTEPQPEAAE